MRTFVRLLLAGLASATLAPAGLARPVVIEPQAELANPEPVNWPVFGGVTATNGEYLMVLGSNTGTGSEEFIERALLLFRRVSGQWQFQQVLHQTSRAYDTYFYPSQFALRGDLAVIELDGELRTWRLTAAGWQAGEPRSGPTRDIEIDGQDIIYSHGDCSWNASVLDFNGATWTATALTGPAHGCDDEWWGGQVDRSGPFAIIGTGYIEEDDRYTPIFQRTTSGWQPYARIPSPQSGGGLENAVALFGNQAIIDSALGAYAFTLPDIYRPRRLQAVGAYAALQSRERDPTIKRTSGLVFVREPNFDRNAHVINVYRDDVAAGWQHVALLVAPRGVSLNKQFDAIDTAAGPLVVASGTQADTVYVFQLPLEFGSQIARYDDFQNGSATQWATLPGSQFAVASAGGNRLFRQSADTVEARAWFLGAATRDQAIEADIKPTAFNGSDRWVGLFTRYEGPQNYYYVTLRSTGTLQLRRMHQGSFTELARAPMSVTLGRTYRVRLESVGTNHRVYVDGQPLLDIDDATWMGAGTSGLSTYRASADFDNVVISPTPYFTLYRNDFTTGGTGGVGSWTFTGSGQWTASGGVFTQGSVLAEARAIIGTPVADQVVRARIRPTAFSTVGTQPPWFGLVARHTDASNYYYASLRANGELSLRRLRAGTVTTLSSTTLPVAAGSTYDLRLEATGRQLRVYLNGRFRLQAEDGTHTSGASGLITYKAAAQFDDYVAYQP